VCTAVPVTAGWLRRGELAVLDAGQPGLGGELGAGLWVLVVVPQGLIEQRRVDVQRADGQGDVGGQATAQRQQQPLQRAGLDRLRVADVDAHQRFPHPDAADTGRHLDGPHLLDRLPRQHGARAARRDDDGGGGEQHPPAAAPAPAGDQHAPQAEEDHADRADQPHRPGRLPGVGKGVGEHHKPQHRQRQAGGGPKQHRRPRAGVGHQDAALVAVAQPQGLQPQAAAPPPGCKQRRRQHAGKEEQRDGGAGAAFGALAGQRQHQPARAQQPPDDEHERDLSPAGEGSCPPVRLLLGRRRRRGCGWPGAPRAAGRRHQQQHQRQGTGRRHHATGDPRASCQRPQQQQGNHGGHRQAEPVAQTPAPQQRGRGEQQHQARHHHRDAELALVGLDQHQQQPKQPKQRGSDAHHTRSGPPAVWSPPPASNRRPQPYHGTTRNRCAERRFPRSRTTVGAKVIGSLSAKLCAFPPGHLVMTFGATVIQSCTSRTLNNPLLACDGRHGWGVPLVIPFPLPVAYHVALSIRSGR
jgi:hypothetical protein